MTNKKYTKKQIKRMETELFNSKTKQKRLNELKKILKNYGWKKN